MKHPTNKEIEDKCLESLNSFMKEFGIEEIQFGARGKHSLKRARGKRAKKITKNKT